MKKDSDCISLTSADIGAVAFFFSFRYSFAKAKIPSEVCLRDG